MRAAWLLSLALGCSSVESAEPQLLRCGLVGHITIRTQKINPDDCWMVTVPEGHGIGEEGGDCASAGRCLVTPNAGADIVDSVSAGPADASWHEVACSEVCP